MSIANAKVIPRNVQSIGITFVKWSRSSPIQPVIGPGSIGKNEPTIPRVVNTSPNKSKNISML